MRGNTARVLPFLLPLVLIQVTTRSHALEGFDPGGSGPGYPESANGRKSECPSLAAHRIKGGPIRIDGRLNEADWIAAHAATGFTQFEPDRLGEPCEETVFKVLYDEDAVYVGVACFRYNGSAVTSCLSRRDNMAVTDKIRVYISPYHDMTTGYHFRVNPHGVKEDYYNFDDLYHDISWDAVWEADTSIDSDGWYAEIRIPFSSIRYREADSMTWGFNVFQYIHSEGERTAWSNWDRDQHGFMSRSGTITGIEGIRPPRQLEITPYVVGRTTDPPDPHNHGFQNEDWDNYGNVGADVKYGVTADLTLNAAFQPDFGQVEVDPALLNLSPFETFYEEKRPFFIEGAQFFYHPDFIMTYSRRIGTGSENSRIRFAGKLTGKVAGDVSTAVMAAVTDETAEGQAHNPFNGGDRKTIYAVGRFGRQFHNDMHSFHVMQNAVIRDKNSFDRQTRNAYVTGADIRLNFKDRMYNINGSFIGSVVDPHADPRAREPRVNPDPVYGTGGRFELMKASGDWQAALTTRLQHDKLDINDFGYIDNPDHYAVQAWVTRVYNADDPEKPISNASLHARWYKSWIYSSRTVTDLDDPATVLWSYERGHEQLESLHLEGDLTTRSYWGIWSGADYNFENTDIYATRRVPGTGERGPLMTAPVGLTSWIGFYTDSRKDYQLDASLNLGTNVEGRNELDVRVGASMVQESWVNHRAQFGFESLHEDAQWVGNLENTEGGIGDVSYVFGELDRTTWDLTWRSSVLFNRDMSIDVYLQPFLTWGDYSNPRELATPDSYDLRPFAGYDIAQNDFSYGAVNLNMVYRWEYLPGSTLYLVWTHTREDFDRRGLNADPDRFENGFDLDPLIDKEAENRFLIKLSYWFAV